MAAGATQGGAAADTSGSATTVPFHGYRPHLDGLRAVAVYLVVAFHAGVDRLPGGFVGAICDPVVDGLVAFRDHTHLTTRYARTMVDGLERYSLDNGVLS